jgi:inner membrane protein involved in colicin E2 resistance
MTMSYKSEQDAIKQRLEADIKRYLASGNQIEQVPLGKSTPVDATNNWPVGYCNDDNVTFHKKVPRHAQVR